MITSPIKNWRRQKISKQFLGKVGKISTWTQIFSAGDDHKTYSPYIVAIVEFEDGIRAYGQLVDVNISNIDSLKDSLVKGVLRKLQEPSKDDIVTYGLKFAML
jgi:uncharacterized OB-fold protein